MTAGPLEGITVVALEQAVAAPFATRQLADLGARVIKVERPEGDFARDYDDAVNGMSSYFVWLNRSKESVVLDLKTPEGIEAMRGLLARADVFVQNLGPGAAERLSLGYEDAKELNPRLVYTSISGYGAGGPYSSRKAYDLLIQCETGLLSVTGSPDAPAKVGISIADIAAGMYAYSGTLSALMQRARTGEGQRVDVSMLEALGEWMGAPYLYTLYGGRPPARTGAAHATIAPYGPYDCSDGTVYFAVQNDREWQRFCAEVLEDPAVAVDPRFATSSARVAARAALDAIIGEVCARMTREELLRRLECAKIANAELRDMGGFAAHPQLDARDRWRLVDSPVGQVRTMLPPVTAEWEHAMGAVPALGASTERVLQEFGLNGFPASYPHEGDETRQNRENRI
ncbi:CaiB/BaiF CoA transferase family protein [Microbacterium immunditiarum]|uniref:Crotonobetainyl-CoA:carnitine CoA-transferase CaiB-like acyl-CoA transferase n=1 Tax=Microbacterium immunditiarum TaxID=337480 RepID=A0A7Y9GNA5_9MICO|nr:CaiB/BaiF CoA-transferase family protein [Microbacterium immunditiarum]NYE19650.1 crotonobetainyl-CoA:carnitine CoA-transferase CaiB-like acyl-CoA transferase [Microbacterium immunditiarum]